jgi:hypothetical protein
MDREVMSGGPSRCDIKLTLYEAYDSSERHDNLVNGFLVLLSAVLCKDTDFP